jgi:hypothetical protein
LPDYPCTIIGSFTPPSYRIPAAATRSSSQQSHTAIVIVPDWTRRQTFLEELHIWLAWVKRCAQGDGGHELEVIRDEHRDSKRCISIKSSFSLPQSRRAPQGRRTSEITPNHPPNCSLQRPALSKARYSCWAQERSPTTRPVYPPSSHVPKQR